LFGAQRFIAVNADSSRVPFTCQIARASSEVRPPLTCRQTRDGYIARDRPELRESGGDLVVPGPVDRRRAGIVRTCRSQQQDTNEGAAPVPCHDLPGPACGCRSIPTIYVARLGSNDSKTAVGVRTCKLRAAERQPHWAHGLRQSIAEERREKCRDPN
jgi:hypothetical protein